MTVDPAIRLSPLGLRVQKNLRLRVKLGQDRLEQLVRFGEWVCGMPDVLAEMARECGALFVGKVELHLDKVPWVRADFNTSDRRFQGRQVIWPRGIMRASERAITSR